jgi:hypothetical protein
MASRQFAHLQERRLQRLLALIPGGCPLRVEVAPRGFRAVTVDEHDQLTGRFQLVEAFVHGWQRLRPAVDAVSRAWLPPAAKPLNER